MSAPVFLFDGPENPPVTLALAHGAGAPMDSPFMQAIAKGVAARGFRVARFEFPYMAARRDGGRKKPPDRTDVLLAAWRDAFATLCGGKPVAIGGKSLGGRMASMIADGIGAAGLVCLGYPFHPPGRTDKPRVGHLAALRTPTLILQGERDPFGTPGEVAAYALSPAIGVGWIADGDHSFKPRKASGRTEAENWADAADRIAVFLAGLARR